MVGTAVCLFVVRRDLSMLPSALCPPPCPFRVMTKIPCCVGARALWAWGLRANSLITETLRVVPCIMSFIPSPPCISRRRCGREMIWRRGRRRRLLPSEERRRWVCKSRLSARIQVHLFSCGRHIKEVVSKNRAHHLPSSRGALCPPFWPVVLQEFAKVPLREAFSVPNISKVDARLLHQYKNVPISAPLVRRGLVWNEGLA